MITKHILLFTRPLPPYLILFFILHAAVAKELFFSFSKKVNLLNRNSVIEQAGAE